MMVILILSLSVAVPRVRESIQRDREIETMQRGKQYIRAIQLYYKKFHAYPPNIDALVKTNDIRFLRKRYIDPTTGKDDWKPILWGQNKTPAAMGFFGQPLAAGFGGGIGPGGGNTPGGLGGGGLFGNPASSGGIGTQQGGGLFNSNPTGGSPTTGTSGSGPTGAPGQNGTGGTTDSNGNPTSTAGSGSNSNSTSTGSSSSSNNPTGSGQAFGGGGIIGFSPASPKQSILVYKKKNHYNEWEFLYNPLMDQQMMGGSNVNTGMPTQTGTNPTNSPNPTPPTPPTTPTTPQQ